MCRVENGSCNCIIPVHCCCSTTLWVNLFSFFSFSALFHTQKLLVTDIVLKTLFLFSLLLLLLLDCDNFTFGNNPIQSWFHKRKTINFVFSTFFSKSVWCMRFEWSNCLLTDEYFSFYFVCFFLFYLFFLPEIRNHKNTTTIVYWIEYMKRVHGTMPMKTLKFFFCNFFSFRLNFDH